MGRLHIALQLIEEARDLANGASQKLADAYEIIENEPFIKKNDEHKYFKTLMVNADERLTGGEQFADLALKWLENQV